MRERAADEMNGIKQMKLEERERPVRRNAINRTLVSCVGCGSVSSWGFALLALSLPALAGPEATSSRVVVDRFSDVPIEMATGELKQYEQPDFDIKSRGWRLQLGRNYQSRRAESGPFGYGWNWTHGDKLVFQEDWMIDYVTAGSTFTIEPDVKYAESYAQTSSGGSGWKQSGKAVGNPDAVGGYKNVAFNEGKIGSLGDLTAGGWQFDDLPSGAYTIVKVELTSIGATEFDSDHPNYGVRMELSAGGSSSMTWGHRAYDFDWVDITSDRGSWSWQDVGNVQARLSVDWYKQNRSMDVFVDTFHLGVTYTENATGEVKYQPGSNFTFEEVGDEYHVKYYDLRRVVFDANGRLLRKIDPNGNTLHFAYDGMNRIYQVKDDVGGYLTFNYEDSTADAKVTNVVDHLGRSCTYVYEDELLIEATDLEGNTTQYEYLTNQVDDALNYNLSKWTDAEGNEARVEYYDEHTVDRVRSYFDELTNEVRFVYLNRTTYSYIPGLGSFQGVVYNATNDLSQVFIREGELTFDETDGINLAANHGATSTTVAQSNTWQSASAAQGETNGWSATHTNMLAGEDLTASGWAFDVPGVSNDVVNVYVAVYGTADASVRLSAGGTAYADWSGASAGWTSLDVTSDRTTWQWDDVNGLEVTLSRPPGATNAADVAIDAFKVTVAYRHFDPGEAPEDRFYFYDLNHNVVGSVRGGSTNEFRYDDRNNVTSRTDGAGGTWAYAYDPVCNRRTRAVDPRGNVSTMEYDAKGNLVKTTDALGNATLLGYDAYGNLLRSTDPLGNTEGYAYDANGVNAIAHTNKRGYVTQYAYDAMGNRIRETDPAGYSRKAVYNNYNQKRWERDRAETYTRYEYDGNGRLLKTIRAADTPEEATTEVVYDAKGRVIEEIAPDGTSLTHDYDGYGNRFWQTDALGNDTLWFFDDYDRVVLEYDALANYTESFHDGRGNVVSNVNARGFASHVTYDGNDRPLIMTDALGNTVNNVYDEAGNRIRQVFTYAGYPGCSETDVPHPLTVAYTYDARNSQITKTEGYGREDARVHRSEYDALGRKVKVTDPLGYYTTTGYDANGNVTNVAMYGSTGEQLGQTAVVFSSRDLPLHTIRYLEDGATYTNSVEYDARRLKTKSTDALGNETTYGYDRHGRMTSVTNALGYVTTMEYDVRGRKVRDTAPNGLVTTYAYDAIGQMTNQVAGFGLDDARSMSFQYDALGRVTTQTDPLGLPSSTAYDEAGNVVSRTDKRGYSTSMDYDALDRLTNTVDALGHAVSLKLDGRGKISRRTDQRGKVSSFVHDVYGQLTHATDPEGNTSTTTYDAKGNKLTQTDPAGLVIGFEYDGGGQVTNRIVGVGLDNAISTAIEYDWLGQVVKQTDPLGYSTVKEYDGAGRVVTVTDRRGYETDMRYDALGRVTNTTDALGYSSTAEYDAMGNVTRSVNRRGYATTSAYDLFGKRLSTTDALTNTTTFVYDLLGRATNTTDALGFSESSAYDANGNIVSKTDKRGHAGTLVYDALNRLTNAVDALGYSAAKTYDPAGNVLTETDKRGFVTSYAYDDHGRVASITDKATNTVTFTYDARGKKLTETYENGLVVAYGYDPFGRLVKRVTGAGRHDARVWTYAHDAAGQVTGETDPLGYVRSYEYDANGKRVKVTDPRAYSTTTAYDPLGRVTNVTDAVGNSVLTQYDPEGAITQVTDRRGNSVTNSHDALGRLLSMVDPESNTTTYEYDAVGNKMRETDPKGTKTRFYHNGLGLVGTNVIGEGLAAARTLETEYDAMGRVVKQIDPLGAYTVMKYDANGNVTNSLSYDSGDTLLRQTRFEYDSRGQLTKRTDPEGNEFSFEYDELGRKTADIDALGNRVEYTYDVYGQVTNQKDQLGHVTRTEYDRLGRKIKVSDALGYETRFEYDPSGNLTAVINDDGNAVYTRYDALNRAIAVNRSMPDVLPATMRRADVNGDGHVDTNDLQALNQLMNP